jgi:FkbM family methyltransferase
MKSQYNEEEIILRYAIQPARFLEIGAYDGVFLSNTYCLLERGWTGVMVEPSPEAFLKLRDNLKQFQDNIQLVNCAIGDKHGLTKFFECDESSTDYIKSISTVIPSHVQWWGSQNSYPKPRFREFHVATVPLIDVLNQFGYDFGFVNIDVEGANEMVLSQLPVSKMDCLQLICVEKDYHGARYDKYLPNFGLIEETPLNLIYARKRKLIFL